jgi:hypothetical protein
MLTLATLFGKKFLSPNLQLTESTNFVIKTNNKKFKDNYNDHQLIQPFYFSVGITPQTGIVKIGGIDI